MKAGSFANHRDADPGRLQAAMPADAQGKANGMAIAQNRPGTMQASVGLVETLAPFAFVAPVPHCATHVAMKRLLPISAALVAVSAGASTPLEIGFEGALRGCETWLLDPASWMDGTAPFEKKVGLGPMMGLVDKVNEAAMPPPELRQANHYWRINATQNAGFFLVVSDRLPMCHITGGGQTDIRPVVAATLGSPDFAQRWTKIGELSSNGLRSIEFHSAVEPKLTMVVSQPDAKSWSLDRLQLIATAQYRLD